MTNLEDLYVIPDDSDWDQTDYNLQREQMGMECYPEPSPFTDDYWDEWLNGPCFTKEPLDPSKRRFAKRPNIPD